MQFQGIDGSEIVKAPSPEELNQKIKDTHEALKATGKKVVSIQLGTPVRDTFYPSNIFIALLCYIDEDKRKSITDKF